jgi:hypothetical protein
MSETLTGLDIHDGLRIRLEYNQERRTILAKFSAENDNLVRAHVEEYIRKREQAIGYAKAWLETWQKGQR